MANKKEQTEPNKEKQQQERPPVEGPNIYITPEMSQSIDILIQAAEKAHNAGGVYNFNEARLIADAITILGQFCPQPRK